MERIFLFPESGKMELNYATVFDLLLSDIRSQITNGSDEKHDIWLKTAKEAIERELRQELFRLYQFLQNPDLMMPETVTEQKIHIYTERVDARLDVGVLEEGLVEFIKTLGFEDAAVRCVAGSFFSIDLKMEPKHFSPAQKKELIKGAPLPYDPTALRAPFLV